MASIFFNINFVNSFLAKMGNESSQSINSHKQHEIESPHFMLSNCKLVLTSKNRLLKSSWSFIEKKIYEEWKSRFAKYLEMLFRSEKYEEIVKNPIYDFVFLPEYHQYVEIGYCSTNGVVNMVYQMVDDSLVRNIEERSIGNNPFTESEVWIMLYILTKTAAYFHSSNLPLGDIRPENIFIAQNEKFIKIATEYSWIFEKNLKGKWAGKDKIFLSEEMIKSIAQDHPLLPKIQFSNDNFAIGMTLAECILLQDLSKMYQTVQDQVIIDKEKHKNIIQSLLKIKYYPLKLLLLVIGMIQLQDENRFTSEEVSRCLDEFKVEILTENAMIMGKAHFKRNFGAKFDKLYSILSHYKSNLSKKLFINRELSLSNAYTINGLSTVQMMKRTYDETFNIEMLDLTSNLTPITYKISQVDDNNKSWNSTDQKFTNFIEKSKRSNVLDQFYISSTDKKTSKSQQRTNKKSEGMNERIKLSPKLIESDVKMISLTPQRQKIMYSPLPVTTHNINFNSQGKKPYFPSPELKIFDAKKDLYEQNFSFHSPQTFQYESPKANSLNKYKKYFESHEILHLTPEAAESIIISNRPSERPSSYVTYEYSKSKTNSVQKDQFQYFPPDLNLPKKMKKTSQTEVFQRDANYVHKRNSLEINRNLFEKF